MVRVSERFLKQITLLAKDGNLTINASNARGVNAADPIDSQDWATKKYIDDEISALSLSGEAGGDLDGYYPNPNVIAAQFDLDRLTFGSITDGEVLVRSGSEIISQPTGGSLTGEAGGDLDGYYPNPNVIAAQFDLDRLTFGSVSDGEILIRSGSDVIGISQNALSIAGDVTGTLADSDVVRLTFDGTQTLDLDTEIEDGYILRRQGNRITGVNIEVAERVPTEAVFTEIYQEIWFDGSKADEVRIQPEALRWVEDDFTDTSTDRFTLYNETTSGVLSISGGTATITLESGSTHSLFVSEGDAIGMPQIFEQITVNSVTGSPGSYFAIVLGVIKNANNYICMNWDQVNGSATFQIKIGSSSFTAAKTILVSSYPVKFAFCIVEATANIMVFKDNVWSLIDSVSLSSYIDFPAEDHSTWFPFFGAVNPSTYTRTVNFNDFIVGRFGGVGLRDICIVTNEDGSAYTGLGPDQYYVLATVAGMTQHQSSEGAFIFNTRTKELVQTGLIMIEREGKIYNDIASHAVKMNDDSVIYLFSTWGNSASTPVRIRLATAASLTDLLTGSVLITNSTQLALTELPSGLQYDPFLIFNNDDGYWYMAYTAHGPVSYSFYPVCDKSEDLSTWINVGADPTALRYEGSRVISFNGTRYALYGGNTNMRMYELESFNFYGVVNALIPISDTQPHPMIWPGPSLFWLLTFDSYKYPDETGQSFTWGRVRLYASPRY